MARLDVYERHLALRVPLEIPDAVRPVTPGWIVQRAEEWLDEFAPGGASGTRIITRRDVWTAVAGEPLPPATWGNINRARGEDYLDDPRAGTQDDPFLLFLDAPRIGISKGFAESVIGHEITHLRFKTLGHSPRFFARVQEGLFTLGSPEFEFHAPSVSAILKIVEPRLIAAKKQAR